MSTNVEKQTNQTTGAKQSGGNRKWTPFLLKNFNIKNFTLTDLEISNERSKTQMILYPRVNGATCVFQTEEFNMSQYGIPPLGDYAKTDAQRMTIKFPFDPKQAACEIMKDRFLQIDGHMKENQTIIFMPVNKNQPKPLKFVYVPIVRDPSSDEDKIIVMKPSEEQQEKKEKFKFWKAKLDSEFPSGKVLTTVFIKDPNDPTIKPEKVKVDSPSDLEKYLNWNSKVKMIIMMNKMWADKTPKEKGADRKYGLGFKILSMEITPRDKPTSYKEEIANYAFIVEDNEQCPVDDQNTSQIQNLDGESTTIIKQPDEDTQVSVDSPLVVVSDNAVEDGSGDGSDNGSGDDSASGGDGSQSEGNVEQEPVVPEPVVIPPKKAPNKSTTASVTTKPTTTPAIAVKSPVKPVPVKVPRK